MPRYFFNVSDGFNIPDEVGAELPDIETARKMAVRFAGEALRDHHEMFWEGSDWSLSVTDTTGKTLFNLRFHAVPEELP